MSIVKFFKDTLLGKFFSKEETVSPPEVEPEYHKEITDGDIKIWVDELCDVEEDAEICLEAEAEAVRPDACPNKERCKSCSCLSTKG